MWLCRFCGKPFQQSLKLLQHRRVHSANRKYICHVGNCTKLYSTLLEYQIHRRSHLDHRLYCCRKCRVKFLTRQHLQDHKCGVRNLQCARCSQRLPSLFALRSHQRIKHSTAQNCFRNERKKLNVKIKFKDKYSAICEKVEVNKTKLETDDTRDKDGNKILLKITAGKSTTIISPKHDRSIRKYTDKHQRKKYKKKQKIEKDKTRNGIILSIKNGSVNLPKTLKSDVCERINGFPKVSTPVKQLSDLKLKIKTYPSIVVEQKNKNKTLSCEVSNLSSLHSKSMTVSPEKLFHEGEKTPNRKQFEETTHISNISESKGRNGIVIVKDKSGRLQAEQLQTAKLRKRDRDNVFDSLSDMHVGIWKVMPSPRTDNPSDILKLRLSPQKPIRLDSGLDTSFESASARYLDVALKTKLYNSGDDSDVFDAGSVLDKDSENGGPSVNDSGIEVLSSSTVRSNGNSVRSVILDESSPNYLNTEDSLLSIDSPITEALSKSEHMLCPKCGSIVIETNNNTRSPGRCRCTVSNPNSPFQTPVSPLKMNMPLIDSGEKQYSESKKKSVSPEQRKEFEAEKSSSPCLAEETSERLAKTDSYKSDSDGSDIMMISLNDSNETASVKKKSSDESEEGNQSLRLKIQLGSNPSALPVKKTECRSPRKLSPDKQTKHLSLDYKANHDDEQMVDIATRNDSRQSAKTIMQEASPPGQLGLNVIPIDDDHDTEEEEKGKKQTSEELFSLSKEENHEHSFNDSSNNATHEHLKTESKGNSPTKHIEKISTNEAHCSCGTSLQDSVSEKCLNCLNELPVSCLSGDEMLANPSAETPQSEEGSTKNSDKCMKKKPIFKSFKSQLNKSEDSKSAVVKNENEQSISQENESIDSYGTKSKYKKPLFKKRTISVDQDQSVKKTKKPLFKRTQSAVENGKSKANKSETDTLYRTSNGPFDDKIITATDLSGNNKIGSETVGSSQIQAIKRDDGEEIESKARNSKQEINVENDANIVVSQIDPVSFKDGQEKVGASVKTEPEDSLQDVLTINQEETTPVSPPALHKAVASALNPFQQQFLSFLSCAKLPDSKGKNKKPVKRASKKTVEKENICKTDSAALEKSAVLEKNAVKAEKDRKKKKQPTSDEEQSKADTFSWLNIFSQANSEENETKKDLVPEIKDEIVDFNVDLAAINQKMDTGEDEELDSFDDMFESKNLSSFQPLQNPKGTWTSKGSRHSVERRNSCKRKRQHNSDSDFSDNSSDGDTIDMYCCHKKHDPDFNPFMDSDDDFMPSKPFKRRISTGRRAKRSQSIGSMSSEGDFKLTLDGDTSSQASRSRRSKQGRKSCCPCCLGSFRDIHEDPFGRRPSYKLPRNAKQFVKSTLRLMQLQEKIHQLFISLFPNCIDLISKVKVGTEEFDMLIEDILFGLESQEVQFEPGTISSDLPSAQGILCQSDGSKMAGMFDEEIAPCGIGNDQVKVGSSFTDANETDVTDHILKSCPTDLSNQKLLENNVSNKLESGDHQKGLLNSGQSAVAEDENSVKCLKSLNREKMTENETLSCDVNAQIVGASDQINLAANNNYPQDSCVALAYGDSHSVPLKDTDAIDLENSVPDVEHVDHDNFDSALNGDDNFVDINTEVPSQLQITIDLSAARVSVCREPKNCLQRLQGQLVKLVKYLLPDLDLKTYFFRNINNLEFLVDLLIKSNGNEFHKGMECTRTPDHSFHVDSVFDLKFENLISEETAASTLTSITDDNGEEIPFEQRIKSQRESLKRDVFEFEEDDTAAMIKKSESVLTNIETLSKMAKRNVRTKSRETRLRKRTAEEKRTLFVQEKVQNYHNSTIICHSKKRTDPAPRSKSSENSKQRFLSELNLGDKSDVTNSTESEVQKTVDTEKPVNEAAVDPKQDLDDLDSESRRKSGDKNIFELMQP